MKVIVTRGQGTTLSERNRADVRLEEEAVKKLAMIVTRGSYNNVLQACELARTAAESGTQVSLLFRDEAVARMTNDTVRDLRLSDAYKGRESRVQEMLQERELNDLQAILRGIKEKGDAKFSVCRDSIQYFDIRVEKLIPELDEVQRLEAFWKEEVLSADQVMTF